MPQENLQTIIMQNWVRGGIRVVLWDCASSEKAISELSSISLSKRLLMPNFCYSN